MEKFRVPFFIIIFIFSWGYVYRFWHEYPSQVRTIFTLDAVGEIEKLSPSEKMTRMGQFGDSFGSLNALFSGLAFTGIFFTIVIQLVSLDTQRKELAMQREELKLQRNEMEEARKVQEASAQALTQQVQEMRRTAELTALSAMVQASREAILHYDHVKRHSGTQQETQRKEEAYKKSLNNFDASYTQLAECVSRVIEKK